MNILTPTLTRRSAIKKPIKFTTFFLCIYSVLLPFEYFMASSAGTILRLLGIVIVISAAVDLYLYQINSIRINRSMVYIAIWLVYLSIACLWAVSPDGMSLYLTYIRNGLLLIVVSLIRFQKKDLRLIYISLTVGAVLMAVYLLVFPASTVVDEISGRMVLYIQGIKYDPNYMATNEIIPFAFCLYSLVNTDKLRWRNLLQVIAIAAMCFVIITSGSRGAFLSVMVITLLILSRAILLRRSLKMMLAFLLIIAVAVVLVVRLMPPALLARFSLDSLTGQDDGAAGRFDIWRSAFKYISAQPIEGYGTGCAVPVISRDFTVNRATHNAFITLLIEGGIISLTIMVVYFISVFRKLFKCHAALEIITLIGILISSFFLDALTTKFFWYMLIIMMIRFNIVDDKESKTQTALE